MTLVFFSGYSFLWVIYIVIILNCLMWSIHSLMKFNEFFFACVKILILKAVMSIHVWEMWDEIVLAHLPLKQCGRALLEWPRRSPVPALSDERNGSKTAPLWHYEVWCFRGSCSSTHVCAHAHVHTHLTMPSLPRNLHTMLSQETNPEALELQQVQTSLRQGIM